MTLCCLCSRCLYDKRISQEVSGEDLGEEFAGYVSALSVVYTVCYEVVTNYIM
jgi:hypothetical protein